MISYCRRTGWRRLIGSPKLQIIFHKRATKYRSLLRKMACKDKGSYESSPPCSSELTFEKLYLAAGSWSLDIEILHLQILCRHSLRHVTVMSHICNNKNIVYKVVVIKYRIPAFADAVYTQFKTCSSYNAHAIMFVSHICNNKYIVYQVVVITYRNPTFLDAVYTQFKTCHFHVMHIQ